MDESESEPALVELPKKGQLSVPLIGIPTADEYVKVCQKISQGKILQLDDKERKCLLKYDPTGEWYEQFRNIVILQIKKRDAPTEHKRGIGQRANRALAKFREPIVRLWEGSPDVLKDPFIHYPIKRKAYHEFIAHESNDYQRDYDPFALFAKVTEAQIPTTGSILEFLTGCREAYPDIRCFNLATGKYYPVEGDEEEEYEEEDEEVIDLEVEDIKDSIADIEDINESNEDINESNEDITESNEDIKDSADTFADFELVLPEDFNPSDRRPGPMLDFHPDLLRSLVGLSYRFNVTLQTISLAAGVISHSWEEGLIPSRRRRPMNPLTRRPKTLKASSSSTDSIDSISGTTRSSKKPKTSKD
jgi:hypothetical protein